MVMKERITKEQKLNCFVYLIKNGITPNVLDTEFMEWLMSIVINETLYSYWRCFTRFDRSDIFKRLLTCGASTEITLDKYFYAFICVDDQSDIPFLLRNWSKLMLLFCFHYKKIDFIF